MNIRTSLRFMHLIRYSALTGVILLGIAGLWHIL